MIAGSLTSHDRCVRHAGRAERATTNRAVQTLSASRFACLACVGYLVATALPLDHDLPLLGLALMGGLAVLWSDRQPAPTPLRRWVIAALASVAIAVIVADDVGRSFRLTVPLLLPAALLFFLITDQFRHVAEVRLVCWAWTLVGAGIALAVVGLHTTGLAGDPSALIARAQLPLLVVPNDVALLGINAPLALTLLVGSSRAGVRVLAAAALALSATAIVLLQSRGAALGMTVGIVMAVWFLRPRLAWSAAIGALTFVVGLDAVRGFPLAAKFQHLADPRLALWLAALAMFRDAPVLGHGAHTFTLRYSDYLSELHLPSWMVVEERHVPWPHNLYLEMLAERGLVGLTALGALLVASFVVGRRLRHARSRDVRVLAAGLFGGLAAFCAVGFVELTLLRQWVWLTLFVLVGSIAWLSRTDRQSKEVFR